MARRAHGLVAAAVVLALLAAGCSDDGGERATTSDEASSSTSTAAAPTTEAADADDWLLTLDDLPEGWEASPDQEGPGDPLAGFGEGDDDEGAGGETEDDCETAQGMPAEAEDDIVARARFGRGEHEALVQAVFQPADEEEATRLFATLMTDLGCTPEGPVVAEPLPGVGDEAFIAVVDTPPYAAFVMAGVRRGAHVSYLFDIALFAEGPADRELVTGLVEVMAERLPG